MPGGRVVFIQRLDRLLVVDLQLLDQPFQRVGLERHAGRVARLEHLQHLAVEDLVNQAAWLLQDHAAVFRVGVRIQIRALVHKASAFDVDHHAVRIGQTVRFIGQITAAVIGRLGIDRCRMTTAPMAPRHGADIHRHFQAVAVVKVRAAHLGVIPRVAEIKPAPRRIGFKPTRGQHHRFRVERGNAVRPARHDAVHATALALRQPHRAGVVADLDTHRLGGLKPRLGQAHTFVHGTHERAFGPFYFAADAHSHDGMGELEMHASFFLDPAHRVIRFINQDGR